MQEIDVEKLMRNVQQQLSQGARLGPVQYDAAQAPVSGGPINALNNSVRTLHFQKSQVGLMPPAPPTIRGRCGRLFVGIVRRSLFWLIEQMDRFHSQIVEVSERQFEALNDLALSRDQLARQVAELSRGLSAEMAAREETDQSLRAEVADRKAVAAAFAAAVDSRGMMEAKLRRLEIAMAGAARVRSNVNSHESANASRARHIGICGTFDVFNYGDLLFPILAEHELKKRLGDVVLHRFSYRSKAQPSWPYDVTSVSDLPDRIGELDGLMIGGGLLVRFDKDVAPGYVAPEESIHHPTGYWLSPALLALQHDIPLVWNAPGMHKTEIPSWSISLLELALGASPYVSVRDELSRAALQPYTLQNVEVVPDTAFGLSNLLDLQAEPSQEFSSFARAHGLERPYIVFQPCRGFEGLVRLIESHPAAFARFQFLVLPISTEFGEYAEDFKAEIPGLIRVSEWPHPLLTAELIGRSEAAVGNSYHFGISGLVGGVPVFRREGLSVGKFTGLQGFDTVFLLPPNDAPELDWFLACIGRKSRSAAVIEATRRVCEHWDRIARVFLEEQPATGPLLNRFWQSLPGIMENSAVTNGMSHAVQARSAD